MMKILFIRHGESTDDVDDQFGGWGDSHLTQKGKDQIKQRAKAVKSLGLNFEIIFSSPLKRAEESADILSKDLGVKVEILELVKERNRYGILSGMNKDRAKDKYPDQFENFEKEKFILASERYDDFVLRVEEAVKYLKKSGYKTLVVVTHGNFLRCLTKEILGEEIVDFGDGGFILVDLLKNKLLSKNLV